MRSIYDIIQEGIFDDDDKRMDLIDKSMIDEWLKKYAIGNYKLKNKNGLITIIGDLHINKFDGETIPFEVWDIQKGSLYITNCPNLKTIKGFLGDYPHCLDGGLFIENNPNLETLEGCPPLVEDFSCIGNKKIKSLIGAPKNVFGNCYIMKNGKRFTEEYIRSIIDVRERIDCSEEEMEANLTEALNEPHLLKLAEFLKSQRSKIKDILPSTYSLDKIQSKDVLTFRYPKNIDAGVKAANLIISGRRAGIILLLDKYGQFTRMINGKSTASLVPGRKFGYREEWTSTDLLNSCRSAHEIVVIYKTEELENWKLQRNRSISKQGVIWNDADQNRQIASDNVDRYKKMAAKIRADRDSSFVKIDAEIEKIVMRTLKLSQLCHKDPVKYNEFEVSTINNMIYSELTYNHRHEAVGSDGLLTVYNRYTKYLASVKKGSAYDFEIRGMRACEQKLIELVERIDTRLKKLGV